MSRSASESQGPSQAYLSILEYDVESQRLRELKHSTDLADERPARRVPLVCAIHPVRLAACEGSLSASRHTP